jgi:hypothetical protein
MSREVTPGEDKKRQTYTAELTPKARHSRKKDRSITGNNLKESRDSIKLTTSLDSDTFTNSSVEALEQ